MRFLVRLKTIHSKSQAEDQRPEGIRNLDNDMSLRDGKLEYSPITGWGRRMDTIRYPGPGKTLFMSGFLGSDIDRLHYRMAVRHRFAPMWAILAMRLRKDLYLLVTIQAQSALVQEARAGAGDSVAIELQRR